MPPSRNPNPAVRAVTAAAALILAGAALPGCTATPAHDSPEAATPTRLAERLPATLQGFERGPAAPLAGRDGIELPYATRGLPAAAAIVQLLPAVGPPGDPAPTEAALAGLVRDSVQSRAARRVRDRGPRFTLPAGGPARLICAETEGTLGRERVEGLLCAGRFTGTLVQIRVTMPQAFPPPADARAFATGIAAALAGPSAGARAPAGSSVGALVLGPLALGPGGAR